MPVGHFDPNMPKITNEIKETNRQLKELTRIIKVGLGVLPVRPGEGVQTNVLAENVQTRLDWLSPAIRGRATMTTIGTTAQIVITVDEADAEKFIASMVRDVPELLQVSSMDVESDR